MKKFLLVCFFLFLPLIVLIPINPSLALPSRDSGSYLYMGSQLLKGQILYQDLWDSKPPAIFYINALALWLFHGSRWGIWVFEYVSLNAAIVCSYLALSKIFGEFPAIFGTLLWVIGLIKTLEGGNLTEEYPLSLHFLSLLLFLYLMENPSKRFYLFLLGFLFSICFLYRPNNAAFELLLIITLFLCQLDFKQLTRTIQMSGWLIFGISIPLIAVLILFWHQGNLQGLLEASILYNISYGTTRLPEGQSSFKAGISLFGWIAWLSILAYMLSVYQFFFSKDKKYIFALVVIGSPIIILISDPNQRNYSHYFMNWLPFIGIATGALLGWILAQLNRYPRVRKTPEWVTNALLLILGLVFALQTGVINQTRQTIFAIQKKGLVKSVVRSPLSIYVQNKTKPDDYVLFWGVLPGENFASTRRTPSGVLFYPFFIPSKISEELSSKFLEDLETHRPVMIVDMGYENIPSLDPVKRQAELSSSSLWPFMPDNLEAVLLFINEHYELKTAVANKAIYYLKTSE